MTTISIVDRFGQRPFTLARAQTECSYQELVDVFLDFRVRFVVFLGQPQTGEHKFFGLCTQMHELPESTNTYRLSLTACCACSRGG